MAVLLKEESKKYIKEIKAREKSESSVGVKDGKRDAAEGNHEVAEEDSDSDDEREHSEQGMAVSQAEGNREGAEEDGGSNDEQGHSEQEMAVSQDVEMEEKKDKGSVVGERGVARSEHEGAKAETDSDGQGILGKDEGATQDVDMQEGTPKSDHRGVDPEDEYFMGNGALTPVSVE